MIPKRICVLGGSTVHGVGDEEGGGFVARLKGWHEQRAPLRNAVFNLGITGNTLSTMLSRAVSEVTARKASLILLYPDLNDCIRRGSPRAALAEEWAAISQMLDSLLSGLRAIAPTIVLTAVPPVENLTFPFAGDYTLFGATLKKWQGWSLTEPALRTVSA